MKKISLIGRCHLQKKAFLILPALFLTQSAMGVVTAHIYQEANDVRVSFSGSLLVDPSLVNDGFGTTTTNSAVIRDNDLVSFADGFLLDEGVGLATLSSLSLGTSAAIPTELERGPVAFGFIDDALIYDESQITGGILGAVTELTYDPLESFFVIEDVTVSAVLGATSVDGDTLFTVNGTNDTIVLSASPVTVPEPSSAILCFIAGIGLLRRKR